MRHPRRCAGRSNHIGGIEAMAHGKWGFAELLSHGWWEPLNTGGCAIALKSGGWSRSFRVAMPDVESESEADRAERNRAVARTLARLGDGWMVEWNTLRRPSPGYPASGAFPDPVTRLIDKAQRLRFLEDGAHFASETFFTLTYQPPSPHKSSVERWIFGGSNADPNAGPVPLADFERESNDLVDPLRPWFDLAPLDAAETVVFIEECISGIHHARIEPLHGNFLAGSLAHEFVAGFRPQIDGRSVLVVALDDFPPASYPQILAGLSAIRASLRFAQRFVCLSPPTAEEVFESHQRNWRQKLYNFGGPRALLSRVRRETRNP